MPTSRKNGFYEFYLQGIDEMEKNKCKANCKLYQVFSDFLQNVATKGEADIIARL